MAEKVSIVERLSKNSEHRQAKSPAVGFRLPQKGAPSDATSLPGALQSETYDMAANEGGM